MRMGRRAFWEGTSLVLLGGWAVNQSDAAWAASEIESQVRVGLITDLHYADKPPAGTRHYRETLEKLSEASESLVGSKPRFVVELGDLIDAADSVEVELSYLRIVNKEFAKVCSERHYVLGNHCVDTLHKSEFLEEVEQEQSFHSFDHGDFHFVVLDSCFRSDDQPYGRRNFKWTDANIPGFELEWLKADLMATEKQVIVFAHQRLDVSNDHGVRNNSQVRSVLESSGRVLAVFQGHSHQNELNEIGGIYYCTLVAMVEGSGADNSGYSLLELWTDGTIRVSGFRKQASYRWP